MVKQFSSKILGILLLTWACYSFPALVEADESQAAAGFVVESVIPTTQVDTTKSYFYLKVEPDIPQTIQVKVRSTQEAAVAVKLGIHDAVSSSNGSIDYTQVKPKLDTSLKNPITELVTLKEEQKEVTVANFEEKIIEYRIQPPKASFSGIKLGALRFVKKAANDQVGQSALSTEYAYVIALMLTEDEQPVNQGAELKLKKVGMKFSKGKKVVAATIQNNQPKLLQGATIKGSIRQKSDTRVSDEQEIEEFSVAPNSNFAFNIPLEQASYPAGIYVFSGVVKADDRKWRWEKEFEIAREIGSRENEEGKIKRFSWVLCLIVVIFFGSSYLVQRQRGWQK